MSEAFRWLLIDSCGATATLAVGRGETVLAVEELTGRAFSANWPAALRRALAAAGMGVAEVEVVGVVHGPGSFTGVRVGLAAAKGLCEAVGAKLVAISRLELLEEGLAVLDAGRDEFYVRDGGVEMLMGRKEFAGVVRGRDLVTADAKVVEEFGGRVVELEAVSGLGILMERVRGDRFDDVGTTDANYVRGEQDIYARKVVGT